MSERVDLAQSIRQANVDGALLPDGAAITVAVSGGQDSVALVHALHRYASERGLSLHVAHLDHALRPESPEGARRVAELAGALGLPASLAVRDVRALAARQGRGIEHAARMARYAFLAAAAAGAGSSMVAVGHTADDQAETVLLRVVRGTGTEGLRGMARRGPYPVAVDDIAALEPTWPAGADVPELVRPLLGTTRAQTAAYVAAEGLTCTPDETNFDTTLARNLVRHEVLPLLAQLNPGVRTALLRLAGAACDDEALLAALIDVSWGRVCLEVSTRRAVLHRQAILELPAAMQRRLLRRALAAVGRGAPDVGWAHVEAAREAAAGTASRGAADLPGRLRVERDGDWVLVFGGGASGDAASADWSVPLVVHGRTELPGGWAIEVEEPWGLPAPSRHADAWTELLEGDLLKSAWLRPRRPGDRMAPAGLGDHNKTLQDIFVDLRIPRSERSLWPVLATATGIVWLPGYRPDRAARPDPGSRSVLRVTARPPGRVAAIFPTTGSVARHG